MKTIASARATALAVSAAFALSIGSTAAVANGLAGPVVASVDTQESYWYAAGDVSLPNGQLWANSAGECWQSAYPDGPNNLPPCEMAVPQSVTIALNFEFDKYVVPDYVVNREVLADIDDYIARVKATPENEYITIVGHTDAKGSDEYNMGLGYRRADAVRDHFIAQGYPEEHLAPAQSMGKRDLLPGVDPFSVEQRRVVITKSDG
ncbi:OmpA family protein [Thiohalocapsa marina]|uniref:OmpA family protein n=1 Tax=Thiohalocapsa marina TaxID=424902 RepID=A0A5M8FNX2_9GAMM|nr:OmpA family protein [Thiohalocapsa marina]KAA6186588.1 OmpA family protein [Thiohalocapsa marina]